MKHNLQDTSLFPRHLEARFAAYLAQFPCVLLLGARQVGKSTFLKHTLPAWHQVDLENTNQARLLADAPDLYLRDHPQQVWFDEAQQVPALFAALRHALDQDRRPGRYVLSGSANPALIREVAQSLAGRVGILRLNPLSAAEQLRLPPPRFLEALLQVPSAAALLAQLTSPPPSVPELRPLWLRGGYPEPALMDDPVAAWRWFDSYIRALSERDLPAVARNLTPQALDRLLQLAAARHGQCLNVADFARDLGITPRTANSYLDALETAFLWRRFPPYLSNIGKRLVKSPKVSLADSGLLHHLLHIHDQQTLDNHPLLGASWEAWVGEQLLRQAALLEPAPASFHWRTQAGAEVDLVFETTGGRLIPIEIKHTARVDAFATRSLRQFLADFADRAPFGVIIHRGQLAARPAENLLAVPVECAVL